MSAYPGAGGETAIATEVRNSLGQTPPELEEQLERAREALLAGRPGEAFLHLRLVEGPASRLGEVRYLLGLAHLESGDVTHAVEELMAASRALPHDRGVAASLERALDSLTGEPTSAPVAPVNGDAQRRDEGTNGDVPAGVSAGASPAIATDGHDGQAVTGAVADDIHAKAAAAEELAAQQAADDVDAQHAAADVDAPGAAKDGSIPDSRGPDAAARPLLHATPAYGAPKAHSAGDSDATVTQTPGATAVEGATSARQQSLPPRVLDLSALRRELALSGGRSTPTAKTVLLGGQGSRSRTHVKWIAAFFVAGALALFGALAAYHRGIPGLPHETPSRSHTASQGGDDDASGNDAAAGGAVTAVDSLAAGKSDEAAPAAERPREASPPRRSETAAGATRSGSPAPADSTAPSAGVDQGATSEESPRYPFLERLGVLAPPGGVLDLANSDASRLVRDGLQTASREAAVVVFRTPARPADVVAFYEGRGGLRFNQRVVPMGAPFQGVERTVARARGRLARGREAIFTVSHPGVDLASKKLVQQTTVRVEIR